MEKILLTCVECPMGCQIQVEVEKGEVLSVTGNTCPRGKIYAQNEVKCPMRVLTTTVKTYDGKMVAVKTDKPVKRESILSLMKKINAVTIDTPVKIGDIIIENLEGDANLVATDDLQ